MSIKRERMRKKAQLDLNKLNPPTKEEKEENHKNVKIKQKSDKQPSFASGFWLILLGSTVMVIFFSIGQTLLGVLAGAAFTFIGSMRISKASGRRTKAMVQKAKMA